MGGDAEASALGRVASRSGGAIGVVWVPPVRGGHRGTGPAGVLADRADRPGRWDADRPAGLGPHDVAEPGGRARVTPPTGARGHHGQAAAAFGHDLAGHREQVAGLGDTAATGIGDRDPGYSLSRAVDLDRKRAAATGGAVRDRVGGELGHADHKDLPGRAAVEQPADEPACLRYRGGYAREDAGPGTPRGPAVPWASRGRTHRTLRFRRKNRICSGHRRSPPDE